MINVASKNSTIACICCLANVFTEQLPSNERKDTQTDTQAVGRDYGVLCWDGFVCHDIHIIVHKDGSDIQKSIAGLTDSQQGDLISLHLFFKITEKANKTKMLGID
jgi:hypothetical protein